jgi:hypothetical protein
MKLKTFSLIIFVLAKCYSQAQSPYAIGISYDASGNRIQRRIIVFENGRKGNVEVLKDSLGKSQVTLFPNPTKNTVTIKVSTTESSSVVIYLYDFFGKVLYRREHSGTDIQLDLSAYAAGMYLLKLESGEKEILWKVMKSE